MKLPFMPFKTLLEQKLLINFRGLTYLNNPLFRDEKKENLSTISLRIVNTSQSFKLEYAKVIIIY